MVGLQHGLISQATQGLLDGGVQGGVQVDGDTGGTNASLPAVKPTAGQRLLRGLYIWQLQIWPEERDATAPAARASELAVQSMGHGHPAELVQRGMAYTEGTQVVLVHVDELLQHKVMLWGRSRCHLSQHSLTLQGNGIYGSQEGGHDLWELKQPAPDNCHQGLGAARDSGVGQQDL